MTYARIALTENRNVSIDNCTARVRQSLPTQSRQKNEIPRPVRTNVGITRNTQITVYVPCSSAAAAAAAATEERARIAAAAAVRSATGRRPSGGRPGGRGKSPGKPMTRRGRTGGLGEAPAPGAPLAIGPTGRVADQRARGRKLAHGPERPLAPFRPRTAVGAVAAGRHLTGAPRKMATRRRAARRSRRRERKTGRAENGARQRDTFRFVFPNESAVSYTRCGSVGCRDFHSKRFLIIFSPSVYCYSRS